MIQNVEAFLKFEDSLISGTALSRKQAMELFDAMWREGVELGVLPSQNPLEGIEVV